MLLRQRVKAVRQQAAIESRADFCKPGIVKIVENIGFHTGPVVYGHV
jgi:hypothetical protein